MARVVYKTVLVLSEHQVLWLPRDAFVQHVGVQRNEIVLWYECDRDLVGQEEAINIFIVGTGQTIPDEAAFHIGSVVISDGTWVWHVYSDVNLLGECRQMMKQLRDEIHQSLNVKLDDDKITVVLGGGDAQKAT